MSFSAHVSHIYIPEKELGKIVAMAMLKSQYSVIISKPYGKWINGYLPMGLSYKDVKEFPTATCLELNCYDDDSFEIKFFTSDRLAFEFESGIGDATEREDLLLKLAEELWIKDNPELVEKAKAAIKKATESVFDSEDDDGTGESEDLSEVENIANFWSLSEDEKKTYLDRAKDSDDYKKLETTSDNEQIPDTSFLEKIIPEGKSADELKQLLQATAHRTKGAPEDAKVKETISKYMDGKEHSDQVSDYLKSFSKFFEVRGSAWSVESIQDKLADKVDRRIIGLEHLES